MKKLQLIFFLVFICNVGFSQKLTKVTSKTAEAHINDYNENSTVIIDGRTRKMYESGHIKNAVNINAFTDDAIKKLYQYLDKEKILIYCTTNNRSQSLIKMLYELDYNGEIVFITDGIKGWKANHFKVIKPKG